MLYLKIVKLVHNGFKSSSPSDFDPQKLEKEEIKNL
jgi:hypothetical protein